MHAPATKQQTLRTIAGEPPLAGMGRFFRKDQGELIEHHRPEYRSELAIIGVLALDDGRWLAYANGFKVDGPIFGTRDAALRCSIARRIRDFRRFARQANGIHWDEGSAGRMIEWALSIAPRKTAAGEPPVPPPPRSEVGSVVAGIEPPGNSPAAPPPRDFDELGFALPPRDLLGSREDKQAERPDSVTIPPEQQQLQRLGDREAPQPGTAVDDPNKITDPVIAELITQHQARTIFPAGHVVHMTMDYADPDKPMQVGVCDCGASFRYRPSQHQTMDAAIEAHRQKFDVASASEHVAVAPTAAPEPACAPLPDAPQPPPEMHAGSPGDDDGFAVVWPSYDGFLEDKIITAQLRGIEVNRDILHPWLKPHCKDLVLWALRLGCAAIFANFGLHKTAMQLEWCRQLHRHSDKPTLCVLPLGVRHGFIKEAEQMGMVTRFIRTAAEMKGDDECHHFLTNYESIRDGKLDPNLFAAVSLDEASVLRSYGSKTFQEFLPLFDKVPFKLVATATPSPNRYKELIHYAGFLGVMDTGQALTRFFQRNSEKAGDLTLYPHKEAEFWMFVHSWAAFLQKPSDLGYSDDGYELPPLKVNWHEVPADHAKAEPERDGQGVMFRDIAKSLSAAAKSRKDSLPARTAKMLAILRADPDPHRIIWHDLEAEREAIEQALPEVVTIHGSMDLDQREKLLADFEEGRIKYFGTKPILSGSGSNFQYHCHKAIYLSLTGFGYKFNDFLQSLFRLQRFGQAFPVEVDIIYSEDERAGRAVLEEKWARDADMRERMSEIIRTHGLDALPLRDALARSIGCKRVEVTSKHDGLWRAINNDTVAECRSWPDNSVDQIITSVPFSNHYEYSASYNDFGHTDDNGHFWSQMDFLTAELHRIIKPGRLACIHVKDRVLFGAVTGEGVPTISPFHAEAIMHYRAHGFQYMGMITVVTDVVRENNQTYRLGWSECCKDGSKMGVGSPEYILLMRKPQSDRTRGYADVPVTKTKWQTELEQIADGAVILDEGGDVDVRRDLAYSRARWQIDAHAFWRSSGDRLLTADEFADCSSADLAKLFAKTSAERIYDYEAHVRIGEALERTGTLPATFMCIAPGSKHPEVWTDINRMRTLNMFQQRKGAEMHLCPLQLDIVDRLIERYSNPGELILDPFGGLMTVPYRAVLKGRRGVGVELSAQYFLDGVTYLEMAEEKITVPALFDIAAFDAANTPPLGPDGD